MRSLERPMKHIDPAVSQRIAILRFLMIFGIVVLHTPMYVAMRDTGPGVFDAIKAFFQSAVFRCSVSMLTCIGGYLLFTNSAVPYKKLVAKKTRTLVVPFLCFNLPVVAISLLVHYGVIGNIGVNTPDLSRPMNLLNAMFGLTQMPANYPLGFLRDLMVLMLLSPLFRWMIATIPALIGIVLVAGTFLFLNLDGPLVLRNEMPVLFYVGALAASKRWDLTRLDRFAWPCLALFLGLCAYYVHFRISNNNPLRIIAPFLIWPAASLLLQTALGAYAAKLSRYSFFIFLSHALVLPITWLLYKKLGTPIGIPYWFYWTVTPFLVCAILIGVYKLSKGGMPSLFSMMTGARV